MIEYRLEQLLRQKAAEQPEMVAVVSENGALTFGELNEQSDRMAATLLRVGCGPGTRVCLLMPKSLAAIVAVYGVLKVGGAYVPLDTDSPPKRLARMVRAADPALVLIAGDTAQTAKALLREMGRDQQVRFAWLDEQPAEPGMEFAFSRDEMLSSEAALAAPPEEDSDIAYTMFTSGSTGEPKGVMITHANVLSFVHWAVQYFCMERGDRVSGHPPLHFDLSAMDIFCATAAGATLHLVPADLGLIPPKLARFIRDSRLTQWFSVPAVMNLLANFDAINGEGFPDLRRVLWCGEVLPTPTLRYWMRRVPHASFTNLYGPTETTIASSYYTVPEIPRSDTAAIPIGSPCDGEELLVLDEYLRPVGENEIGNLFIGGVGLSPGYWQDQEKTAQAFIADPRGGSRRLYQTGDLARIDEKGLVCFHGRADTQIKSRGYRIELGEIEAALQSVQTLREAAVVAIQSNGFETWSICCAFVPNGTTISPIDIKDHLRGLLPGYMLPMRWLELDALPRNPNGKVDRPRLRQLFGEAHARGTSH